MDYKGTSSAEYNAYLESQGQSLGKQRFHDRRVKTTEYINKDGEVITVTTPVSDIQRLASDFSVIEAALPKVADAIEALVAKYSSKKMGRPRKGVEHFVRLVPDYAAYLGLSIMGEASKAQSEHQTVVKKLGQAAENECYSTGLRDFDYQLWKRLQDRAIRRFDNQRDAFMSVKAIAAKAGYNPPKWTPETVAHVGAELWSVVLESSGVFQEYEENGRRRCKKTGKMKPHTKKLVQLTDQAASEIRDKLETAQWMEPVFPVMAVEPIPFGQGRNAPYLDQTLSGLVPLIRKASPDQRKYAAEMIRSGEMQIPVEAVNALGQTKLMVDELVVEAVKWVWLNYSPYGEQHKDFPRSTELPEEDNDDMAIDPEDETAIKREKFKRREKRRRNSAIRADIMQMGLTMASVKMVTPNGQPIAYHVPYNMDFRGRLNPVSTFNHYQADHIKAMHRYYEPTLLTPEGAAWLFIHIASVGDFDKVSKESFQARVEWVESNWDRLIEIGRDYKGTYKGTEPGQIYWSDADKQFQFLAACSELAKAVEAWDAGQDYYCGLSVNCDGSNSSIQHYSAMLKYNGKDAELVNLKPLDKPQDIYAYIAHHVEEEVRADAPAADFVHDCSCETGEPMCNNCTQMLAKLWLDHGITRSVCKRGVMTYGYNSNAYGMTDQIMEDLMTPYYNDVIEGKRAAHPFAFGNDANGFKAARYLARKLYRIIQRELTASTIGMEFLKDLVKLCSEDNKHFKLLSPVNFPFHQNYRHLGTNEIKPYMYSRGMRKRTQITLTTDNEEDGADEQDAANDNTPPIEKKDSMDAVSANTVHMYDATHMQMVIVQSKHQGIDNMMMLHDSFGTTPSEMPLMFNIIRETFILLYTTFEPYEDIRQQVIDLIEDPEIQAEIPYAPHRGNLDLDAIYDSLYSFH